MHQAAQNARLAADPLELRARLRELDAERLDVATVNRRPTSAFRSIPRVSTLRRLCSPVRLIPVSSASPSSASAEISVMSAW